MYRRWVLRTGPMVVSGAEPSMEWKLRRGGLKAMEISSIPQGRREFSQGVLGQVAVTAPLNSAVKEKKRTPATVDLHGDGLVQRMEWSDD